MADSAQQTVDVEESGIVQDIDDADTAAPHTFDSSDNEDSRSQESEHSVTDDAETSTAREDDVHDQCSTEGQIPSSQDTRIFVRQRDSNMSCEEFGDLSVCTGDSSILHRVDTEATYASLTQVDCHDRETTRSTVSPNANFEEGADSRSDVAVNSLCPGSQVNAELDHSPSAASVSACSWPDYVSLNISERTENNDSVVATNKTSCTTEL